MIVKKKTVSSFVVLFSADEVQKLSDIRDVFDVEPEDVIERSIEESLTLGVQGVNKLIRTITTKKEDRDGDSD